MKLGLVAVQEDVFKYEKVFLENRIFEYCGIYNPVNHVLYKDNQPLCNLTPTEFTRIIDAVILFSTDHLVSFIELCVKNLKHLYIVNSKYLSCTDLKKLKTLNHEARSVIYPGPVDFNKIIIRSLIKEDETPYLIIFDHHIVGRRHEILERIPSPLLLNLDILHAFIPQRISGLNLNNSSLSEISESVIDTRIDFCNGSYACIAINETQTKETRITRICYPGKIYDIDLLNHKIKVFSKDSVNHFKLNDTIVISKAIPENYFALMLTVFLEKICRYNYEIQNIDENLEVFEIASELELKMKRSSKLLY